MEIVKFGTLHYGGYPAPPNAPYTSYLDGITIGDSMPKKEISWVKVGTLFVSTKVIALGVNWDDLYRIGLIYGRPITIDGKPYLCRSPSVGKLNEDSSEWADIVDSCNNEEKCTVLSPERWFWGQEKAPSFKDAHIICGYSSLKMKSYADDDTQTWDCGFRPVLEPMDSDFDSCVSDSLIGKTLSMCGLRGRITGTLKETSDYDLRLSRRSVSGLLEDLSGWASLHGDDIVVTRDQIRFMRIEKGDE